MLAWMLLVAGLTCVVIGVAPVLQATRARHLGAAPAGRRVTVRGHRGLVAAQVCVATVLVVATAVMVGALDQMLDVEPGLDPRGVLVQDVLLPPWEYPTAGARMAAAERTLDVVTTTPGVASAAIVASVPFVGTGLEVSVQSDERDDGRPLPVAVLNATLGPYFATMGIPLATGRAPSADEEREGAAVALVSRTLAARLWPGESAVGRSIRHSQAGSRSPSVDSDQPWLTVIGVVGDVRNEGPGRPSRAELYVPWGRSPGAYLTLVARSAGEPLALSTDVRAALSGATPGVAFSQPSTMEDALAFSVWTERLSSIFGMFAALALGLATIGVHAVVAHSTRRRGHEIGIRVALGASSSRIRTAVTLDTVRTIGPGLVVGLALAYGLGVVATRRVAWIPPPDLVSMALGVAVLATAALLAAYLPARSASRADPAEVLRIGPIRGGHDRVRQPHSDELFAACVLGADHVQADP